MKPSYRISPFSTASISLNSTLPSPTEDAGFFNNRHPNYHQNYLLKARNGITLALKNLNLSENDFVTILTTTGNMYVSGCVTKAIESVCKWNREVTENTKAVLVVHEFGTVFNQMDKLYQLGIPVIEDFAHSFNSTAKSAGKSDFVIYSFPKYFPIQYGGILLSRNALTIHSAISAPQEDYIKRVVSEHIGFIDQYAKKRWENYYYLINKFSNYNCSPRFTFSETETPSVFMFCPPADVNLVALKAYMQSNGIECSVFYGEQSFFIPLHDKLHKTDLDYFVFVYGEFIKRGE
ncbi:DegT/DnrJ/EryC1/StrS family aminotransferase [Enterobacter sp. Bisph1]|uniref:DegT/DnrJ/EryC1/StrS family aminotransferase n=1 Tax=Enterobacter sp. Bisph1 TaxID=1274399 RepID=UPI0018CE993F|nr:DegT/DnrJ/EryC1/StrS family aminotransferase [Enterobacter sp. Bisph1]